MKKLILFICLLPFFAQAQWTTGAIQRDTNDSLRYFFGSISRPFLTRAQSDARYFSKTQSDARFLKLTGGALTGLVTNTNYFNSNLGFAVLKDGAAGFLGNNIYQNAAGTNRWGLGIQTAETGSGATGSDLYGYAYNDAGTQGGTPWIWVKRSSNDVTFGANVTGTFNGSLNGNALTATTATNLAGGSGGTIPYQSAAGTTAMLANGTAGYILQANGTTVAPSWVVAPSADVYTPTLTAGANTATATPGVCFWHRIGNIVKVEGVFSFTLTTPAVDAVIDVSLPVASNFAASENSRGHGVSNITSSVGTASADVANDRVSFTLKAPSGDGGFFFTFSYIVL
jgi:hypothetical protein